RREERVNAIIADYLRALDAGQAPDRAEWLARHPDLADALRSFFADHDAAAGLTTPERPAAAMPTPGPAAPAAPRCFGDYELLGELGRGGMGVVYRARQTSAGREVALKMIKSGAADED